MHTGRPRAYVVLNLPGGNATWTQAANAIKSSAPGVKIVWPVKPGHGELRQLPAGADVVGVDLTYDPKASWSDEVTGAGGIEDIAQLARENGKKIAIHWSADPSSDPDATTQWMGHVRDLIDQLHHENRLAWEVWHETRATKTRAPQVARTYRALFGNRS